MTRRLKRFELKNEFYDLLKVRIKSSEGESILEGSIANISLTSISIVSNIDFTNYIDKKVEAEIIIHDKDNLQIGNAYVLRQDKIEQNSKGLDELREQTEKNNYILEADHEYMNEIIEEMAKRNTQIKENNGLYLVIIKALNGNIPIEDIMRFIDNEEGESPFSFEMKHGKFTLADFYSYKGSDDILEKANLFKSMQDSWIKKNVYQFERYRHESMGVRVDLDIKRSNGNTDFLVFGSNDYLGLASHPEVIRSAKNALDTYGFGATGSSVSTGLSTEHKKLQDFLSSIFEKENTLLYNSGYTANVGILSALCRSGDLVVFDQLSHASIRDALKMSSAQGATCIPFKHNNMEDLEQILRENRSKHSGCLVVTEGIFSMDGYIANMKDIVTLAKKYNTRTFLDVAHDFGVIGPRGLGAGDYHGVLNEIDIIMGTFSKIGGGIGGFCCGSSATIEYLRFMSRSFMFSVSMPPSFAAGVLKALTIFWEDRSLLEKLKYNIKYFTQELIKLGIDISSNHQSSICPVVVGDEEKLDIMSKILFDHGVYVTPVTFPVVSKKRSRFRFTITALHEKTDLDYAILVLGMAMKEAQLKPTAK